ncbi:hypothetical protein J2Z69_001698 [Paenibacillus shirakamiensis]|uniref:DUF4083 domain-containing protein n=1 Tax=Paenibacillus shirakamiensis TaxID=1265935 RepID=A0ABS4JG27_9BACL|nr:hypothetical protein [Paenibacillus shirakamiensis]
MSSGDFYVYTLTLQSLIVLMLVLIYISSLKKSAILKKLEHRITKLNIKDHTE